MADIFKETVKKKIVRFSQRANGKDAIAWTKKPRIPGGCWKISCSLEKEQFYQEKNRSEAKYSHQ
jgi:hypothetical protein